MVKVGIQKLKELGPPSLKHQYGVGIAVGKVRYWRQNCIGQNEKSQDATGEDCKMDSYIRAEIEYYLLDKIKENKSFPRVQRLYQEAYNEFCENILED